MKTRNGIYYDLNKSTYKLTLPDTNKTFVFSSDLHLVKFEEQYIEHRKELNLKFKSRYNVEFDLKELPDLILYRKIEKRGFLILNNGGNMSCPTTIILNGEKLMKKS